MTVFTFAASGTLAKGTKVTVLSHGSAFDYVKSGSVRGYVRNSRLSTKKVAGSGKALLPLPSTKSKSSKSSGSYRPEVDSDGITREVADKMGYTYTSAHGGHYIGSNDHWDPEAGVYHD